MSQQNIIIAVVVFALLVAGMFSFAFIKKQELQQDAPAPVVTEEDGLYPAVTRITAKQFYVNSEHVLVGEVELPTPCDLLSADVRVMESFPEQIVVDFTVLNTAEACAQVITNQRFKVSAMASKEATFAATFMGRPVELNLVPAEPGESPDDFELFIKG